MGLIWLPTIRTGTGTDVYTQRLAQGLEGFGYRARITWLPHALELAPWLLAALKPPAGTTIIHGNSWHAMGLACHGLPLVVTVHHLSGTPTSNGLQRLYHRLLIRSYERVALRRAWRIIAVSPSTQQGLIAAYAPAPHKLRTIVNGIDPSLFSPRAISLPTTPPVRLLFVGKPSYRKGVDRLAPIMHRLGAGFELLCATAGRAIVPAPPGAVVLDRLAQPAALADLYRSAHMLVAPSRLEGFGLAAVEAQSCGLPVVAADVPGLCDTVCHGKTGFLVPGDDIGAYAQAIRTLADDVALRHQMGQQARQWVIEHFDEQTMLQRYAALYMELEAA